MGPLILQTFGAHWTAVTGVRKLDNTDDPGLPVGKPVVGLSLTVAAISIPICHRSMLMICRLNRLSR